MFLRNFAIMFVLFCFAHNGKAGVIYNSILSPLPPSSPSLGYQATSTDQFGNMIQFAGTARDLNLVEVVMTNWAYESKYQPVGTSEGFNHNLTFNIYDVGSGNTVGALLATETVNAFIPWRPEPSTGCTGNAYSMDGNCYNGSNSIVTFAFSGVTLPDQVIYGLSYNTQTHGDNPIGAAGPYNSLNFGLATVVPNVGVDPVAGTLYWDTSHGPFYADNGAGGIDIFRADADWGSYTPQARFNATSEVPEPGTILLSGLGLLALGLLRRRRQANS